MLPVLSQMDSLMIHRGFEIFLSSDADHGTDRQSIHLLHPCHLASHIHKHAEILHLDAVFAEILGDLFQIIIELFMVSCILKIQVLEERFSLLSGYLVFATLTMPCIHLFILSGFR